MELVQILTILEKARAFSKVAKAAKLELIQAKANDGKLDTEEVLGIVAGALDDVLTGGLLHRAPKEKQPVTEQSGGQGEK